KIDPTYLGLREKAFEIQPQVALNNNEQCYAVVVDLPLSKENFATLFCTFSDEHVSLYYSTGGGLLGINQGNAEVAKAGGSLCFSAGQLIKFAQKTDDFSFKASQSTAAYLFVRDGIYTMSIPKNPEAAEKPYQFLNFLVQNVLTEIRKSQEK
ncbi:MAG: hypothetical protein LBI13_04305, partial [Streptococcaceae bacterium]|nr:hypothetical protein [Streptococcaceae bacterium]